MTWTWRLVWKWTKLCDILKIKSNIFLIRLKNPDGPESFCTIAVGWFRPAGISYHLSFEKVNKTKHFEANPMIYQMEKLSNCELLVIISERARRINFVSFLRIFIPRKQISSLSPFWPGMSNLFNKPSTRNPEFDPEYLYNPSNSYKFNSWASGPYSNSISLSVPFHPSPRLEKSIRSCDQSLERLLRENCKNWIRVGALRSGIRITLRQCVHQKNVFSPFLLSEKMKIKYSDQAIEVDACSRVAEDKKTAHFYSTNYYNGDNWLECCWQKGYTPFEQTKKCFLLQWHIEKDGKA